MRGFFKLKIIAVSFLLCNLVEVVLSRSPRPDNCKDPDNCEECEDWESNDCGKKCSKLCTKCWKYDSGRLLSTLLNKKRELSPTYSRVDDYQCTADECAENGCT